MGSILSHGMIGDAGTTDHRDDDDDAHNVRVLP